MPRTPDRFPGESDEEGMILSDEGVSPNTVGELRRKAGALYAKDDIGVFNLRGTSHSEVFEASMGAGQDEIFGQVTGLSAPPMKAEGINIYERDAVVQSGSSYHLQVYELTTDGFKWRITMAPDEYWPGPGSVTLRIFYTWSEL